MEGGGKEGLILKKLNPTIFICGKCRKSFKEKTIFFKTKKFKIELKTLKFLVII